MSAPQSDLPIVHVTAAIDTQPPGECYLNLATMTTARVVSPDTPGAPVELDLTTLATTGVGRPQAQRATVVGADAQTVLDALARLAGEAPLASQVAAVDPQVRPVEQPLPRRFRVGRGAVRRGWRQRPEAVTDPAVG
jgi:hypothetical protein